MPPSAHTKPVRRSSTCTRAIRRTGVPTSGAPTMLVEERLKPCAHFKPEVASLNMGSMNFGLFPMLRRYKEFKHDWEPQMLENSRDLVFRNSFKDITYALNTLNATGTRYEF